MYALLILCASIFFCGVSMEVQHYVSLVCPSLKPKFELDSSICGAGLRLRQDSLSLVCVILEGFVLELKKINVAPLALRSSDVAVPHPDKKSVIMYVTSLFQVLPQSISMEAIKEVETLPRAASASIARVTTEEHYQIQTQQRFSQQVRHTHTHMYTHWNVLL